MFRMFVESMKEPEVSEDEDESPVSPAGSLGETPLDGARKSLLIGINYLGQGGELRGCVNDVLLLRRYLELEGFPTNDADQRVLVERSGFLHPTRANILEAIDWLVEDAEPGDSLFFHYSGHGTRIHDMDGDEDDGYDEAICPVDYATNGFVLDDDIQSRLVAKIPKGCRLTAIMDCCHSGTALDLPYVFKATEENLSADPIMHMAAHWGLDTEGLLACMGNPQMFNTMMIMAHMGGNRPTAKEKALKAANEKHVEGEIVMISGCADHQTSADVWDTSQFEIPPETGPGGSGGACTNALVQTLFKYKNLTWLELLQRMREYLESEGFDQIPQLSSSVNVPLEAPFVLHD